MSEDREGVRRPDITHTFDQVGALLRDLGPVLVAYREVLVRAGASEALADRLVLAAQATILGSVRSDDQEAAG